MGAQKRWERVEGIQRSQREQKQEHASAERYNRSPAVLALCSHAPPRVSNRLQLKRFHKYDDVLRVWLTQASFRPSKLRLPGTRLCRDGLPI